MATPSRVLTTPELRQLLLDQVLLDRIGWKEPILGQADFGASLITTVNEVLIDWLIDHDFSPINLVDLFGHYRQRLQAYGKAEQLQLRIEEPADNPALPSRITVGEIESGQEHQRLGWWAEAKPLYRARRDVSLTLFMEHFPDLPRALGEDVPLIVFRRIERLDTWFSGEAVAIPPPLIAQLATISERSLQPGQKRKKKIIRLPEAGQLQISSVSPGLQRFEFHFPGSACLPLWAVHYPENPRPLLDGQ